MESITIVGAGGIGCAVGYALAAGGLAVRFIETNAGKLATGRATGMQVDHLPPLPADFFSFVDWSPHPSDVVLLCTKCYDNGPVLARLPASVTLVPIQNGFDPALNARGHALEGIASFVSECLPDRPHTRITRSGRLHLGFRKPDPRAETACQRLLNAFALGQSRMRSLKRIRLESVAEILPYKYSKLMYNAAISPLAAAAGLDNGELLWAPPARRAFFALLRENYEILHGAGVPLGRIGPFHPDTVYGILRRSLLANLLAWAFYPTLRGSYCSMSGDLPRGRTEIANYNGYLIEIAGARPCPLNRRVCAMVEHLEREHRTADVATVAEWLTL